MHDDVVLVHEAAAELVEGIGAASAKRFELTLSMKPGETVDFVVGWGRNKNNINDATALDAKIALQP